MLEPFSRRKSPRPSAFRYDFPKTARIRIVATMDDRFAEFESNHDFSLGGFTKVLEQTIKSVYRRDGEVATPFLNLNASVAREHVQYCSNDRAFDFFEFMSCVMTASALPHLKATIDQIFEQEGIGYDFVVPRPNKNNPSPHGEFVHKDTKFIHKEVVGPALVILEHAKLETANDEMLEAYNDYRHGDYSGAIVKACACMESVLKTILKAKRKTWDEKDTLAKLSEKCNAANIYPTFVHEIIKNTGSIRNKMGAHGGGPTPEYKATKEYADYTLQLVASHINMVAKLVKL